MFYLQLWVQRTAHVMDSKLGLGGGQPWERWSEALMASDGLAEGRYRREGGVNDRSVYSSTQRNRPATTAAPPPSSFELILITCRGY